jgi:ABC-type branched-subunit amino acid transport system substrate-binding protein
MKHGNFGKLTLFAILFFLASLQIAGAQQPVFRIGVLDNERGAVSSGARLAVQEINAAGGVRGADGTMFQLELIFQPTNFGSNLDDAINNLRQANVIAALGPETNAEVLNGLPILQSLNAPILTPATNDTLIRLDTSGRIFRTRAAQILQEQALASYLINDLNLRGIATIQLDIESTDSVIGFSNAAASFGVMPQPALIFQSDVSDLANRILQANSDVAVTFGSPALASTLYTTLRESGWQGIFAYNKIEDENFRSSVPFEQLNGILSVTTWPFAAIDEASDTFLGNFVRAFGTVPGPIEAATYDSVYLLAEAIGRPGELLANLPQLDNVRGVQGLLRPVQLSRGETSNNVAVVQIGGLGAPRVIARYAGGVRLPPDQPGTASTPLPPPTATPDGVVITILNERQNVRSGPSIDYDVLGQLQKGDQARVIGANADNTWVVIDFRGRQGWLATYLLEVFGNLNSVPLINPPPTPTPGFTPTPVPPPEADIVIDSAAVVPSPIIPNQPFNVSVVVRNAGNSNAGQFAIAATFPPNNVYSAILIPGLAVGQTTVANLTATLSNTGFYTVAIVADLNNEVPEGIGEGNNYFNFSYTVDKPALNQGSRTLNAGENFDLEGINQADVNWNVNGQQLDALGSARLGIINNVTLESVHWDLINPSIVNQGTVLRTQMNAGTIIGVLTADGNRGVIRVDDLPGNQMRLTFKVYQN